MQSTESIPSSPPSRPSDDIESYSPQSKPATTQRFPVIYVLHSSQLYGTERMALATARGLADEFETIFIGPPGPGLVEAQRLGFQTRQYRSSLDLATVLRPLLKKYRSLTFVGTGPRYNLVCIALNLFYRRKIKQIQILHGGSGIEKDYDRKKILNLFDITFVVVSEWSKQRLISHGVRNRVEVIGNFLIPAQLEAIPTRPAYNAPGFRRGLLSRALIGLSAWISYLMHWIFARNWATSHFEYSEWGRILTASASALGGRIPMWNSSVTATTSPAKWRRPISSSTLAPWRRSVWRCLRRWR